MSVISMGKALIDTVKIDLKANKIAFTKEIKKATKKAHVDLERKVTKEIKQIKTEADYIKMLKVFYHYFQPLSEQIDRFITADVLADKAQRRNASSLKHDIEELGGSISSDASPQLPEITNVHQALGAMYVFEWAILGGRFVIEMLKKRSMKRGFSFFQGYGEGGGEKWNYFLTVLNQHAESDEAKQEINVAASQTFHCFSLLF
ncbi:MAG: biliverdin-producing heme oxygenase [Salibacteraceae bacterium]